MLSMSSWKRMGTREALLSYMGVCNYLMYEDEDVVRDVTGTLREKISKWAREKSEVYSNLEGIISKSELEDKDKWYVKEVQNEWQRTSTSGSTTGKPFHYLRWAPSFDAIEWGSHYDMVLDEFGIGQNPQVMYFFSDYYKKKDGEFILKSGKSHIMLNNHGMKRNPTVHYVNFDMYKENQRDFFSYLFEYLEENPIDVLFTSGPQIRSMCNYSIELEAKHKFGKLLSNTNEKILSEDVSFLLERDFFDHACDHMRCWDGGAGFFTCSQGTYHLMDHLSWCEEIEGKLVSTDYFNLSSPFVNYWNGDYCKIEKEYQRCECGRLFREFEFMENRPFSIKGVCMRDLQGKIEALGITGVTQVRCSISFLDVISDRELSPQEKALISGTSDKFDFRFQVEAN